MLMLLAFLGIMIAIVMLSGSASADTHTTIGTGNANAAGTWDNGVPAPGDDLVFTGAYNIAMNQAITYGNITLQATYSGVATQSAGVDFGYNNFNEAAGTWTGYADNSQTVSGSITRTGGTYSNDFRIIATGVSKTYSFGQVKTYKALTVNNGASIILSESSFIGHFVNNGAITINSGTVTIMTRTGNTFTNAGTIGGAGVIVLELYNGDMSLALGNYNVPVTLTLNSASAAGRTLTMTANSTFTSLTITSAHATYTTTLKTNAKTINCYSTTVTTRGILDCDTSTITCSYLFDAVNGTYTPDTSKLVIQDGGVAKFNGVKPYNMELASYGFSNLFRIYATTGKVFWNVTGMDASRLSNFYINSTYVSQITTSGSGGVAINHSVVGMHTFELREIPIIAAAPSLTLAEGVTYSQTFVADQSVTWSIASNAWNFLQTNGTAVYGTPTWRNIGTYWVNVTITNANGVTYDNTTLEVLDNPNIIFGADLVWHPEDSPGNLPKDHSTAYALAIGMTAMFGILGTLAYVKGRKKK